MGNQFTKRPTTTHIKDLLSPHRGPRSGHQMCSGSGHSSVRHLHRTAWCGKGLGHDRRVVPVGSPHDDCPFAIDPITARVQLRTSIHQSRAPPIGCCPSSSSSQGQVLSGTHFLRLLANGPRGLCLFLYYFFYVTVNELTPAEGWSAGVKHKVFRSVFICSGLDSAKTR